MAYTLEQLEILKGAIAEGALEVKYGDKWVKYRTLDDMLRIKSEIEKELGLQTIKGGRTYGKFDKDL
jgi:hypothetical protein